MERNGIDKLKKACIILPLVVAVIFNWILAWALWCAFTEEICLLCDDDGFDIVWR